MTGTDFALNQVTVAQLNAYVHGIEPRSSKHTLRGFNCVRLRARTSKVVEVDVIETS